MKSVSFELPIQAAAKPTNWTVRLAKSQIDLGIHPVWSESSLSAWKNLGTLVTYKAHSEDSGQTGQMPRLIWVFNGRTHHFVGFVMLRLILRKNTWVCVSFIGDIRYRSVCDKRKLRACISNVFVTFHLAVNFVGATFIQGTQENI